MFTAAQFAVQLGNEEQAFSVLAAVGTGAHLAEGRGVLTAYIALVPWTFPTTYDQYIHAYERQEKYKGNCE